MAAFLTETFTGSNGASITTLSGWTQHPSAPIGDFLIQTNRAYSGPVNTSIFYNTAAPASADYSVEAQIYVASIPTSAKVGVVAHLDTAASTETSYDFVYNSQLGHWRIQRNNAGAGLVLGSYVQTLTVGQTYTVKLEIVGNVLNGYVDNVLRVAVDDSAAPIIAAGRAGVKKVGTSLATSTTGLHFDSLTATDAGSDPGVPDLESISYVGVGSAPTTGSSASLTPSLPSGLIADDLLICIAYEKSSSGVYTAPTGWDQIASFGGSGKSRAWTRFYQAGDTAPVVGIDSKSTAGITQVAAFRNVDKTTTLDVLGAVASGSGATNVGPAAGITPSVAGAVVIVVGGRGNDWTSVATLSGDGLTWAEISETDSTTPPIGLVWDYAILPGDPVAVGAKTFTTTGAGTSTWVAYMLSLRPTAPAAPAETGLMKVKIGGVFTTKPAKRKAAGAFATKPVKALSDHPDPPPWTGQNPTYVLPTVETQNQAMQLTYTPGSAPSSQNIFPVIASNVAQPLGYQVHPGDPGEAGMNILVYEGLSNVEGASEANLDIFKSRGIDGWLLLSNQLPDQGTSQANFDADLAWAMNFADTHPQFRCTLGIQMTNNPINWCPFAPWFNDTHWSTTLTKLQQAAVGVRDSALIGLSLAGEPHGGAKNGWRSDGVAIGQGAYNEAGTSYTGAQVRTKVKARAKSIADTIAAITGPVEIYEYYLLLPGSLKEAQMMGGINKVSPGTPKSLDDHVTADWIDGMTSNSQVKLYHINMAWYKPDRLAGLSSWEEAALFDKANYDGDPRLRKPNSFQTPFIWITEGPNARGDVPNPCTALNTCADRAFSVPEVTEQLQAARRYAEGGMFALYDQGNMGPSAWAPYAPALQAASF